MKIRLITVLLILFAGVTASGQIAEKSLDSAEYEKALDLLLPLDGVAGTFDHAITIRVRPSFDPDYLVTIVSKGKEIEISVVEAKAGNIFNFLSSIVRTTELEFADDLIKKVELQTTKSTISESRFIRYKKHFDNQIRKILMAKVRRTPLSVGSDSTVLVPLDGTTYDIRFVATDEIRWSAYDYSMDSANFKHELVYWIKSVVQRIAKEAVFSDSAAIKASLNSAAKTKSTVSVR